MIHNGVILIIENAVKELFSFLNLLISVHRDIPATLHILTGPPTTSSSCPTQETTKSFTVSGQPQQALTDSVLRKTFISNHI